MLALVVPLIFDVVISTSRGLETARYFLFVVPFLLLLLADGLMAIPIRLRIASLAVLVAAMFFGTRATKQSVSRDSDYRSTAALLDQERKPGDRIMLQPREMNAPLRFYLHSRTDSIIGLAADASPDVSSRSSGRDERGSCSTIARRSTRWRLRSSPTRCARRCCSTRTRRMSAWACVSRS